MSREEKRIALDKAARARAVKGWSFRGLSAEENKKILEFLNGGECPNNYQTLYDLARKQLKI